MANISSEVTAIRSKSPLYGKEARGYIADSLDKVNTEAVCYGTCATAAATVAKVVTCSGFTLAAGAKITVTFTYANTAASPTLNVNSTGAIAISRLSNWEAGATVLFVYDGTYWRMMEAVAQKCFFGTCATAAATVAKAVTCTSFSTGTLVVGARVSVSFTYANTATSPTLNVNSSGAKAIYKDGVAAASGAWGAGQTVDFVYDGTYWRMVSVVQLTDGVTSTSTTTAATPNAVKTAYDTANIAKDTADAAAQNASTAVTAVAGAAEAAALAKAAAADATAAANAVKDTSVGDLALKVAAAKADEYGIFLDQSTDATNGYWFKLFEVTDSSSGSGAVDFNFSLDVLGLYHAVAAFPFNAKMEISLRVTGTTVTTYNGFAWTDYSSPYVGKTANDYKDNFAINLVLTGTTQKLEFWVYNNTVFNGCKVSIINRSGRYYLTPQALTTYQINGHSATDGTVLPALPNTGTIIYSTVGVGVGNVDKITKDNGYFKLRVNATDDNNDMLSRVLELGSGMHTLYVQVGAVNNPIDRSVRGIYHQGESGQYGWLIVLDDYGNIFTNYVVPTGWRGWRRFYSDADTVPIANGGTGATTAAAARTALGILAIEEGTWTPSINATTSSVTVDGTYIKVGNTVNVSFYVYANITANQVTALEILGLPYTSRFGSISVGGGGYMSIPQADTTAQSPNGFRVTPGATTIYPMCIDTYGSAGRVFVQKLGYYTFNGSITYKTS